MTNSTQESYVESLRPGTALARLMTLRDVDISQVADATGTSAPTLEAVISGETAISDDLADGLAALFDRPKDYWLNLRGTYELATSKEARLSAPDVESEVGLLKRFKVKEAVALGWLPASRDKRELVLHTREFLGVDRLKDFALKNGRRFRIAGHRDAYTPEALGMWLRQGEIEAARRESAEFCPDTFANNVSEIRKLTMRSPFSSLPAMSWLCAQAGVGFIVVENLPATGAKGATCWKPDGSPWIQINVKGNWLESFWFTFFHEAAHVLRGKRVSTVHVDGDLRDADLSEGAVLDEKDADRRAGELLISSRDWNAILSSSQPEPSPGVVEYFATRIGLHPGIIVGRLQQAGKVRWDDARFNRLKTRVTLTERKGLSGTGIRHERPGQDSITSRS